MQYWHNLNDLVSAYLKRNQETIRVLVTKKKDQQTNRNKVLNQRQKSEQTSKSKVALFFCHEHFMF